MFSSYLNRPVIRASLWTFGGYGSSQVIRLISNLILTRLLFPEAFGLMALVMVFTQALAMFSDVGTQAAIIQNERGEDPAFLNTAWTIHIIRGFALWVATCAIAWPVAQFYKEPILFPLLCFVGVNAAIGGFQSMAIPTANRKLWLGRITVIGFANQVAQIMITIGLAWYFRSVWALAIGSVLGNLIGVVLGHIFLPWHHHALHIERRAVGTLFRFGRWIFLSTLVTYLGGRGMQAIQGALVSVETLGYLSIAGIFAWAMGDLTGRFIGTVAFPKLAMTARDDPNKFRETMGRLRNRMLVLTLPIFVTLSLLAVPLIDFLYDKRYAVAGPFLAILTINAAIAVLPMMYTNAFLARGDSRTPFILGISSMSLRVVGLLVGFHVGGTLGMLVGIGAGTLLHCFVVAFLSQRAGFLSWGTDVLALMFIFTGAATSLCWINSIVR